MKSPHFFQPPAQQITSIGTFLSSACEKIAETIPKFKDLKSKREKKGDGTGDGGTTNGQDINQQQEQEIVRTDTNAEEEEEFRAQNFEGPGEQMVTQEQIESLASLIGADWIKLAQELEMPDDSIAALKKKQVPVQACNVVLTQWSESEGLTATVKRLRNILLKAELFNEDVSAVLNTASTGAVSGYASNASDSPRSIQEIRTGASPPPEREVEEVEPRPARISSSVSISKKRSSNADGNRAATPVMDERQSTASNA